MPSVFKLEIPKFVTFIIQRLHHSGHDAYIVGGAVRDACLRRPISDWDVATSALPEEIKSIFSDIRFFYLKHGTVTLIDSGKRFEVTSFRGIKDLLEDDLARRDFTINAMAYDLDKAQFRDPSGGLSDLKQKEIRAVGDPAARFQEDPLRLVRAVTLASELGFRIVPDTLDSVTKLAPLLRYVAPERIRGELMRILVSTKPSTGFKLMVRTNLLKQVIPELLDGYLKRQNAHHRHTIFRHIMETVDGVRPDPVLRLTALFHDIAKPRVRDKADGKWRFFGHETMGATLAGEIMDRLRFRKDMTRMVTNLVRNHMINYDRGWSDAAVRRLIRGVGVYQITDLLMFRRADLLAHGLPSDEAADPLALLKELQERVREQLRGSVPTKTSDLPINGFKVMEILGLPSGPEIGEVLNNLMEKVTDRPELNDEKRLIELLRQMKRHRPPVDPHGQAHESA